MSGFFPGKSKLGGQLVLVGFKLSDSFAKRLAEPVGGHESRHFCQFVFHRVKLATQR
jgi:hypothetical protein